NIITLLKVAIILFFIGCGLYTIWQHPNYMEKFSDFTPKGLGGIAVAMGLTFVAFEGYEIIVQAGEEVRNPRRNLPKAVFLSLLIVVPIYMAVAFVFLGAVHVPPGTNLAIYQWLGKLGELGLIQAGAQFVPLGKYLLLLAALLSTMSALNATTFSSSRVAFAMGRDRNLPDRFGQVHSDRKTPHWALIFSGIIMIVVLSSLPVKDVASAADIMFLLLFLQVNVAVISIRKQFGDKLGYGYLIPFFPWIPIAGIVTKLFLAVWLFTYSAVAWYYTLAWLALGGVIYFAYAAKREKKVEIAPVISERRVLPKPDIFRVLVPVANPETAKQLIRYGAQFVQPRTGELLVLHVVSVPDQTPLTFGRNFVSKSNMVLDQAVTIAEDLDVPVSRLIRIAHNPADAIISTIQEYNVNFSIMGWRGRPEDRHTIIGRDIDQISRTANTNLIILEKSLPTEVGSVLIPLANAKQAAFAVRVAGMLFPNAPSEEPLLTLLHVNAEQTAGEAMVKRIKNNLTEFEEHEQPLEWPGRWEVKLKLAKKSMPVILTASADYDAMLLETSQGLLRHQHFSGRTFRTLARGAQCPVILLKSKEGSVKFGAHRITHFLRELIR
ncbi:MAG: amino acid permease, partial [Calditrichota bacterium]